VDVPADILDEFLMKPKEVQYVWEVVNSMSEVLKGIEMEKKPPSFASEFTSATIKYADTIRDISRKFGDETPEHSTLTSATIKYVDTIRSITRKFGDQTPELLTLSCWIYYQRKKDEYPCVLVKNKTQTTWSMVEL
jgi:hypothetical protein